MTNGKNDTQDEMKNIIKGAAMYTSGSILGPLLFFGGLGMSLDAYFQKKPLFILLGVGIAFVVTNVFLFRRSRELTKKMSEYSQKAKEEQNKKSL